jgi:hypothetical protein
MMPDALVQATPCSDVTEQVERLPADLNGERQVVLIEL